MFSYSGLRMRIGLAYNEKPDASAASDAYAEWDDPSTIDAVDQALSLFGNVIRLEADEFFPQKLSLARPDIVFNMAEGLHGPCRVSRSTDRAVSGHRARHRPRAHAAAVSVVRQTGRGRIW